MKRKENSRLRIFEIKHHILYVLLLMLVLCCPGCGSNEAGSHNWGGFRPGRENTESEEAEEEIEEEPEEDIYEDMHLKLSVTDEGVDAFSPRKGYSFDYRYGPSLLLDDNGGIDAYFASRGDTGNELDWITYKHSDDGGETWSEEKVVLCPTPLSRDELSVCDPDVFFYDGYYYMGYTATLDTTGQGIVNSVFLARSKNPDGPFEKWDGKGWSGDPEPVIYYDGVWNGWGTGEPSFVVLDDKLFVYSTRDAYDADNNRIKATEVHIADITDENWPAHLEFAGYAVIRTDTVGEESEADYTYDDSDSWDVAYIEEYEKFVAISTNRRFANDSCLLYYESNDGVYFERVSELNTNVYCGCHNAGIMSDGMGHIKEGDPVKIGYAYNGSNSSSWGIWAARIAPVSVEITQYTDRSEDVAQNVKKPITYKGSDSGTWPACITAENNAKSVNAGGNDVTMYYAWIDNHRNSHALNPTDVDFSGYDENIISVEDGIITPLSEGMTSIAIAYEGVSRYIRFRVFPEGDSISADMADRRSIRSLFSPTDKYIISLSRPFAVAVRPIIRRKDYSLCEVSFENIIYHGVVFESLDDSVCTIRADGLITPLSPGETRIRVSCKDGQRYTVPVTVLE